MKIILKLFSPFCLIVSTLILIYVFYKSELVWMGNKREFFFSYYILSICLIFFSVGSFYLNRSFKEYLIIITISIVVGLYLSESYLLFKDNFFKSSREVNKLYKKQTKKEYDIRTKLEIFNDLKKNDNDITLAIHPSIFLNKNYELYPLSGISNSKTIFCNENGYYAIYESDRYGFNNPDSEWDQSEIEYLLVGDSFTHGACVNRPDDIASVLRKLSNKSVLNLGFEDNGPLIEFAVLREFLSTKVKKVLWLYYEENDFRDLNEELTNNILKNYLDDLSFKQNLILKQNEVDVLVNKIFQSELKKKLFNFNKFIKLDKLRSIFIKGKKTKIRPQPEFKKILELTKDLTDRNNTKLYFIYLPEYNRYKSNFDNSNYKLVKTIVEDLNIPFIDLNLLLFNNEKEPLKLFPFELFGHYTVEGYQKAAQTIFNLTKN